MTDSTPPTTAAETEWARALALRSQSSALPIELRQKLEPAKPDDFRRELTACLALCAPAGFDESTRREWLTTAWATLNGIPADLLKEGCRAARVICDHPAKIVPVIMREIGKAWDWRKQQAADAQRATTPRHNGPVAIAEVVTPKQIEEIKAEFGIVTNPFAEKPKATGAARMPTRADYIALGVDPVVLAALPDQAA